MGRVNGRESLSRERIIRAALRLVDQGGMDALSMRRLAAELGVDPMAIYYHLPGKDAVISGLVETVFSEMRVPPAEGKTWQDRVRGFARAYRDLARAHPNLVLHLVSNPQAAASASVQATEALYEALEVAGMPPRIVVLGADLVVDYVNGFALAESARPLGHPEDRREMLAQLESQAPERFPVMRRVFGALSEDELPADFEFSLDVLLAGLKAIAVGTTAPPPAPASAQGTTTEPESQEPPPAPEAEPVEPAEEDSLARLRSAKRRASRR